MLPVFGRLLGAWTRSLRLPGPACFPAHDNQQASYLLAILQARSGTTVKSHTNIGEYLSDHNRVPKAGNSPVPVAIRSGQHLRSDIDLAREGITTSNREIPAYRE